VSAKLYCSAVLVWFILGLRRLLFLEPLRSLVLAAVFRSEAYQVIGNGNTRRATTNKPFIHMFVLQGRDIWLLNISMLTSDTETVTSVGKHSLSGSRML